jgi:hypothetical protein
MSEGTSKHFSTMACRSCSSRWDDKPEAHLSRARSLKRKLSSINSHRIFCASSTGTVGQCWMVEGKGWSEVHPKHLQRWPWLAHVDKPNLACSCVPEAHQEENHATVDQTREMLSFLLKKLIRCRQVEIHSMWQRILCGESRWWKQKLLPQEIDTMCDKMPGLLPF